MSKISYDVGLFPNHDAKVRHFFETTKFILLKNLK